MQEVPLFPLWFTLAVTAWGAIGPFVGIFVGSYLARAGQRRQWMADNRVQEWRELISTLVGCVEALGRAGHQNAPTTEEREIQLLEADTTAMRAISNRVFISKDMQQEQLPKRWKTLELVS